MAGQVGGGEEEVGEGSREDRQGESSRRSCRAKVERRSLPGGLHTVKTCAPPPTRGGTEADHCVACAGCVTRAAGCVVEEGEVGEKEVRAGVVEEDAVCCPSSRGCTSMYLPHDGADRRKQPPEPAD